MDSQQLKNIQFTEGANQTNILIVDDDLDALASLRDLLELEMDNCSIDLASDIKQAKLLAQQIPPDIALLDIKLGRDNGLDLIPVLKGINPDIACIMMTAHRDNKYTVKALRLGANDYLLKPVAPVELIHTVERLRYQHGLKKRVERAENESKAKSEFLSRMSHELRTPMNAILGFGQILEMQSDGFNEIQRSNINEILQAGHHLLGLINEVLDMARIESGRMEVVIEKTIISDVLQQSLALIQSQAKAHHIEIIDCLSNKGHIVLADSMRLKQVFVNVLSNAVKYNIEEGCITLSSDVVDEHHVRICITDTGKGLTEDEISKLFTSFERLNSSNNVEGTGIGLVISKHLVELMGGGIGVDSVPGEGSVFWLELPLYTDA